MKIKDVRGANRASQDDVQPEQGGDKEQEYGAEGEDGLKEGREQVQEDLGSAVRLEPRKEPS